VQSGANQKQVENMIYRVTICETSSRQPSNTYWQTDVAYIGTSATEARIAYHRSQPQDFSYGYGNQARITEFEVLAEDDLEDVDVGEFCAEEID
jgi:hypothetical protein